MNTAMVFHKAMKVAEDFGTLLPFLLLTDCDGGEYWQVLPLLDSNEAQEVKTRRLRLWGRYYARRRPRISEVYLFQPLMLKFEGRTQRLAFVSGRGLDNQAYTAEVRTVCGSGRTVWFETRHQVVYLDDEFLWAFTEAFFSEAGKPLAPSAN